MEYVFDWDPKKAALNLRTHRVGFERAATMFLDSRSYGIPAHRASTGGAASRQRARLKIPLPLRQLHQRVAVVTGAGVFDTGSLYVARAATDRRERPLHAPHVGAERDEALLDALVAAVDLMHVVDHALALCTQGGDQQRHAGADVGADHRLTVER